MDQSATLKTIQIEENLEFPVIDNLDEPDMGNIPNEALNKARYEIFACSVCQKTFKSQLYRRGHELRVHNIRAYKAKADRPRSEAVYSCDQCGKTYTRKDSFERHKMQGHVAVDESSLTCPVCGKKFAQPRQLKAHMIIHAEQRRYGCSFEGCEKRFNNSGQLNVHLRVHTRETPYECELCEERFKSQGDLTKHFRKHLSREETRKVPCEQCDKRFLCQSDLAVHMRSHTKERPFACDSCGKTYLHKIHLLEHQRRRHTGEKPFVCGECGHAFISKYCLDRHSVKHTGEKRYVCNVCDNRYSDPSSLRVHRQKQNHHKTDDNRDSK